MPFSERLINVMTGEETTRPYTKAETDAVKAEQARIAAEQAEREAAAAEAVAAKQAILDRLGLTAEEAALLLS
jgi:hypothetical protein